MKGFSSQKERDELLRGLQFIHQDSNFSQFIHQDSNFAGLCIISQCLLTIICQTFFSHISLSERNRLRNINVEIGYSRTLSKA